MLKLFGTLAALVLTANASGLGKKRFHGFANDVIMPPLADNSTYGNTEEIHTTHVSLDLWVDFDERTLNGTARHTMNVIADKTTLAQYDIWNLEIFGVSSDGHMLSYNILQPNPLIGSVLQVELP